MLKNALHFLGNLAEHNNREWFQEHRSEYLAAHQEFESFVSGLLAGISVFDTEISKLAPKDCLFRIYRDVRFSPDKRPYKTHFGAYMAPKGGRKSIYGGYYFHLEPLNSGFEGQSFCSGGLYCPDPAVLKAVRMEIVDYSQEFKTLIGNPEFVRLFGHLEGPDLKSVPRGFPKDFPDKELLKYRNYVFMHPLSGELLGSGQLLSHVLPVMQAMKPCNDFVNRAISYSIENPHV